MSGLIDELKRRHVFRVGAAYLLMGWVLAQVGDLLADNLAWPDRIMPILLVVLALGFPLALLLAWIFELTSGGLRRHGSATGDASPPADLHQDILFCQADDGVQLAYATTGTGEPLVKAATWMTHIEDDLTSSFWRDLIHNVSAYRRLIRFDQRGNGLSDRKVETISAARFASDLETVIDAAGVEKCALLGISQGASTAIEFAVKYPHRVTHLILVGSFAHGQIKFGGDKARETVDALKELMRIGWGQKNPTFRKVFTSLFIPSATPELADEFDAIQRSTTSADNAMRIFEAIAEIDVDDLLAKVTVPTLVLHARDDAAIPIKEGRFIASKIPGARFVTLDTDNHLPLAGEPASKVLLAEIRAFLANPSE